MTIGKFPMRGPNWAAMAPMASIFARCSSRPCQAITAAGSAVGEEASSDQVGGIRVIADATAQARSSNDGLSESRSSSHPPSLSALWNASQNNFSERCRNSPRLAVAAAVAAP